MLGITAHPIDLIYGFLLAHNTAKTVETVETVKFAVKDLINFLNMTIKGILSDGMLRIKAKV